MTTQLKLGKISIDVVRKDIKNVHLSVYPPSGRVRVAAPRRMRLETIRVFAVAKLGWIKAQQRKLAAQQREVPKEYVERESHLVWGERKLLRINEVAAPPCVEIKGRGLLLSVRPNATKEKRQDVIEAWRRQQLREEAQRFVRKWEKRLGLRVERIFIQRMKTKWGSANPSKRTIRLNLELSKKPRECLEYIVVHEMLHFLAPNHGEKFITLLRRQMPHWRDIRDDLNALPLEDYGLDRELKRAA